MRAMATILLISLCSCASYVERMHSKIQDEQRVQQRRNLAPAQRAAYGQKRFYDPYNGYRGIPVDKRDRLPIENPLTLGGPQVDSNVVAARRNMKRYTASDLQDNSEGASLWDGTNSESFLFVQNNVKRKGDVVVVEVMDKLKSTITEELKRAFPLAVNPQASAAGPEAEEENEEEAAKATPPGAPKKDDASKVYDKISSFVVEEVNKDYLMIRGRKEVLFKNKKRFVELRALVSRKNIKSNDMVSSETLLEPKVTALRY